MTVIAYDGLYVAADRLIVNEGGLRAITRKLDVVEDWVLATSGAADHGDALVVWFKDGRKPDAYPRHHDGDKSAYMYAFKHGMPVLCFQTWPTPILFSMEMFTAGTGGDIARTAMHLGRDAREACKIACELNVYCGEGVEYVSLSELKMTGKAEVRAYAA